MNRLSRSTNAGAILARMLALVVLAISCSPAAPTPAASPTSIESSRDPAEDKVPPVSGVEERPLTLLAEPPAPKAQPTEPVSERGWLGVSLGSSPSGVVVDRVVPGSPAEQAGLGLGDVILKVAGEPVREPGDVVRIVARHASGERIPIGLRKAGEPEGGRVTLLGVKLAGRPVDSDITRMSFVGQPAPELGMLKTVKGSVTPTLQALRGKVVVLEFWASWCAVCRFMVPTLNEWQSRFGPQGAVVLGVTVDSVSVASTAADQLGMNYPLASDGEGTATRAYAANAVPTLFVIDQRGTVREVIIGYSEAELARAETLIDGLLDGS